MGDAHTGERRGDTCFGCAGLESVDDQSSHRPGPQDGPQVPVRRAGGAGASRELLGAVAWVHHGEVRRGSAPAGGDAARRADRGGFDRSYPTVVRELRRLSLRPVCLVCQQRRGNAPTTEIDHPPAEEIQWDSLELPAWFIECQIPPAAANDPKCAARGVAAHDTEPHTSHPRRRLRLTRRASAE